MRHLRHDYFFEPAPSAFSTSAVSTPEMTSSDSAASSAAAGTATFPADYARTLVGHRLCGDMETAP